MNITNEEVNRVSDSVLDGSELQEQIDDLMDEHLIEVAGIIAKKRGLSEEEHEELFERLAWTLVLLEPAKPAFHDDATGPTT